MPCETLYQIASGHGRSAGCPAIGVVWSMLRCVILSIHQAPYHQVCSYTLGSIA